VTELSIFHVLTGSWSSRLINGSGPMGRAVSCFVFLPEQSIIPASYFPAGRYLASFIDTEMLACVAQVKPGFYLYFLDTHSCEWVKLIKCTDMEAKLLPNPQLLCDGSSLFVLLTSVCFLSISSLSWDGTHIIRHQGICTSCV